MHIPSATVWPYLIRLLAMGVFLKSILHIVWPPLFQTRFIQEWTFHHCSIVFLAGKNCSSSSEKWKCFCFLFSYQGSTIVCLHSAIEGACGKEAADLSLGPALDELKPNLKAKPSKTVEVQKPQKRTKWSSASETESRASSRRKLFDFLYVMLAAGLLFC